jgi:hypothetical protein
MTIPAARLSRASALLRDGLLLRADGPTAFAVALDVEIATVDAFISGRDLMPLDVQRRLATFVIENVPTLARMGHRLQAQVAAATDFNDRRTTTHNASPPRS